MLGFQHYIVIIIILTSCLQYTSGTSWYILATTIGAVVFMALATYDHDYWKRRGIYAPPACPLVGHILSVVLFKEQGGMCFKRIYDENKDLRFFGTHQFYQRTLVVRDPELIKRICVNDFQHFVDRGFFFNKEVDPLAGSVLFLRGNEWKKLRAKISPIFSPNKLRGMFPLIENTANEFVLRIQKLIDSKHNNNIDDNYLKIDKIISKDIKNKVITNGTEIMSKDLENEAMINDTKYKFNTSKKVWTKGTEIMSKYMRNNVFTNGTERISKNVEIFDKETNKMELKQVVDENGNSELTRNKILENLITQKDIQIAEKNYVTAKAADESSDHNFMDSQDKIIVKIEENSKTSDKFLKLDDEKRFSESSQLKRILSNEAVMESRVKEIVDFLENKQSNQLNRDSTKFKSFSFDRDKQISFTQENRTNGFGTITNGKKLGYNSYDSDPNISIAKKIIKNDNFKSIQAKLKNLENRHEKSKEIIETTENPNKSSDTSKKSSVNIVETSEIVLVDSEKLVGGYTADAIVPCAFGLKSNVMDNENDPFAVALHAFYEMSLFNIFEKTMRQFWPAFVLFFRMRIIPKKTHDFFHNIVTSVLRARENGEQEKRGDFIDMMMALRTNDKENADVDSENDVEITDMVISANAFIIFLGGFETTSSTLAFLLLELAANPQVQDALRHEIHQVLDNHGGTVSYEVLQEMAYMDTVIQETLRLYPPFPSIQRMCTKDYHIPGSDAVVEKGTIVLFPTLGIQRDEQYFENAGAFVPGRWNSSKPPPPGVYMPFGDGPRYCIGKRFAMIQMKCCLIRLLQHVRFSPATESARTEPFAADPRSPLTLHPADSRVKISLLRHN